MINDIINGIAIALGTAFPGVTVYADDIRQGFDEPSFYIKDVTTNQTQIVGTRYMRRMSLDVHYFPESKVEPMDEIRTVVEGLYDALEYIGEPGSILRGINMSHQVYDGVLHFLVDYNTTLIKQVTPLDPMGDLVIIQ